MSQHRSLCRKYNVNDKTNSKHEPSFTAHNIDSAKQLLLTAIKYSG